MLRDPLPAQFPFREHEKILILGFLPDRTVVYVNAEGHLGFSAEDTVHTDWRYDPDQDDWRDWSLVEPPVASEEA